MAAPRSRATAAASVLVVLAVLPSAGCVRMTMGAQYEDSRRLQVEARRTMSVRPVAQVDKRLWGFILFGNVISRPDPEALRDSYLTEPDLRITNWQMIETTMEILYLNLLFSFPTARVIFDVVEVSDDAP